MRVGVVSDTHMPRFGRRLPLALKRGLLDSGVELILHLGDFTAPEVPALFEEIAPIEGVAGNNDPPALIDRFGLRKIVQLDGARVGMLHGHPIGRREPAHTRDRALAAFGRERLDAILFGHSHLPLCEREDGRWLVNPGSPTDRRRSPSYSYAILEVRDGTIAVEMRSYADRSAK